MKQIPKGLFDSFIEHTRRFWDSGDKSLLKERLTIALDIQSRRGIDWLSVADLVDSIIRFNGFLPGADNEKIYEVLRVLGWEVAEDV